MNMTRKDCEQDLCFCEQENTKIFKAYRFREHVLSHVTVLFI